MKPVEAFDCRGVVGYLSAYITDPAVPALMVQRVAADPGPWPLSVNLVEHGWLPDGLEIAVKVYEPSHARLADMLATHGVLERTSREIPGPHGPGWRVYKLADIKPEARAAWEAWKVSLGDSEPAPEGYDTSPENLKRLTTLHVRRYEDRLAWSSGTNPAELRRLLATWMTVEHENYLWDNLSEDARREIRDAIEDGE